VLTVPKTTRDEAFYAGWHDGVTLSTGPWQGLVVPFVVVAESAIAPPSVDGLSAIVGHELAEVTTDPFFDAYLTVDQAHIVWSAFGGTAIAESEIGDMCAAEMSITPSRPAYALPRIWSNSSAAASHDPCVPSPQGQVYFNAAPVLPDIVSVREQSTRGVRLQSCEQKTIEVDLFSDGPTVGV
jgi:hypothetical protein